MSTEQNHIVLGKGDLSLDAFGQQVVTQRHSLFHALFTYDVSPRLFHGDINGSEEDLDTSTQIQSIKGRLSMETIANSGDTVVLESRRHPRYQPNRAHHCAMSIGIPVPVNNAVEDWGMFTDDNGVFFRCGVDGDLYACIQSGGTLTHEEKITLPCTFDESNLDIVKGNNYDIDFQWRGVGNYNFFIENPRTELFELVHKIKMLNTLDEQVSIENPALPIAYRCVSLGDIGKLWSGCADITTTGLAEDRSQFQSAISLGTSIGTDTPVLVIRQPETIGGEINTRDIRIARASASCDKRSVATIWVTRDQTAIVGGSYSVIGRGSFVEINTTATSVDITKMTSINHVRIEALTSNSKQNPDPRTLEQYLIHGDIMVITGTDGGSAVMDAILEWGEEV